MHTYIYTGLKIGVVAYRKMRITFGVIANHFDIANRKTANHF